MQVPTTEWREAVAPDEASRFAFAQQVEQAVFDPWDALAGHRPLGDVMRARKVVYFASERTRGAL